MIPKPIPFVALSASLLTALAGLTGCGKEAPVAPAPPRPVLTVEVPAPSAIIERRYTGQVETAEGAALAFESGGRVVAVNAKEGTRYEAGTVLAKVDETSYRNQLNSAEASLTNAKQELSRVNQLYASGNTSLSNVESATASKASAEASFENARKALEDCSLKMPYDGVIGTIGIEAQQVVSSGEKVMTIQGESGKEFEIGVPAENVGALKEGVSGRVSLRTLPEETFEAKITEISPDVADNGTYPVILTFSPEASANPAVRAGMDGECALTLPNPKGKAIRIPAACVVGAPGGDNYVWVVAPEADARTVAVQKRVVTTGALSGEGDIEVLSGLEPGETVVSRGVHSLDEGMVVALP